MITENLDVVTHAMNSFTLNNAAKQIEIRSPLESISGINKQYIRLSHTNAVDDGLTTQHTATTVGIGIDLAMSVVSVENYKILS